VGYIVRVILRAGYIGRGKIIKNGIYTTDLLKIKECGVPNLPKNPVNKRRTGNLKGVILCKIHTRRYLNIIKKEKVLVQSVDTIEEFKQLIAIQYRKSNCKHIAENLSSKNPATKNQLIEG